MAVAEKMKTNTTIEFSPWLQLKFPHSQRQVHPSLIYSIYNGSSKHVSTNNKIMMPGGGCKSLSNEGAVRLNSGGAEPGSDASGRDRVLRLRGST